MNSSNARQVKPDILVLEANPNGKDYIIGDLHGNWKCLESVFSVLTVEDKLVVLGDLVDRGKDSWKIINALIILNKSNKAVVVRGNHEELALQSINKLEDSLFRVTEFSDIKAPLSTKLPRLQQIWAKNTALSVHKKNGGGWLQELFLEELESGLIEAKREEDTTSPQEDIISMPKEVIYYHAESKIKKIKDFFESLPYIVYVKEGPNSSPFIAVHADLPFSTDELFLKRLEMPFPLLTSEEKKHALWERTSLSKPYFAHSVAKRILVYCGHSIVIDEKNPVIRAATNSVNIDVGAYKYKRILLVDHTGGMAQYRGRKLSANSKGIFKSVLDKVNTHLASQKKLKGMSQPRFFSSSSKSTTIHTNSPGTPVLGR